MGKVRKSPLQLGQVLAGLVVASVVLGACGSSNPKPSTTTSTSAPTTTVKTIAACTTALITITPVFGGSAAGGSYYRFNVTNIGPGECALDGYPALTFFSPNAAGGAGSGGPVSLTVTDSGPAPTRVVLKHSESAQFLLAYTEVPVNGAGCSTVASVDVRLPGQAASTPVPVSFSPCGGVIKVYAFAVPGTVNP